MGVWADPENAGICLADREGRDRIWTCVNEDGNPEIVLFDAERNEFDRLPEEKETGNHQE